MYGINKIINFRLEILKYIIILTFSFFIIYLFYLQITKQSVYKKIVEEKSIITITGFTAPRGIIYDKNMNVLVDNKQVKEIYYVKDNNALEELEIALTLSTLLDVKIDVSESQLKEFWLIQNDVMIESYSDYNDKLISYDEYYNLKLNYITEEDLNAINKEQATIYFLMNEGYSYTDKIIKSNVSEEEYAKVAEVLSKLNGVDVRTTWVRNYPYGDTFKTILGTVGYMTKDLEEYYQDTNYSLNDMVGLSYLEMQYDHYLKGQNEIYQIVDGQKVLIQEGIVGNDLVLSIDINLQLEVERIIEEELIKAKQEPNTEFFNHAYVVITNPSTGGILAMASKQIITTNNEYKIIDYTQNILTSPVVVGSVVKGASHIVGYNTGAITFGEIRYDTCLKFNNLNEKCSWRPLGKLDDLTALKYSSNTYQYHTVLNVGNSNYKYNSDLSISDDAFSIYKETFKQFGLGVKTEIDLPFESIGYVGNKTDDYLLLDYSIGQYDTYTALQLAQYIATIANDGSRLKLNLLNEVKNNNETIFKYEPIILNAVDTDISYLNRIQEGFKMVMDVGGTGSMYINRIYSPAGKTGTSQTFYDKDLNGIVDTETISSTFVGYAPYENPIATFTVITPDITHKEGQSDYQSLINRRITQEVSKKFFEIYQ